MNRAALGGPHDHAELVARLDAAAALRRLGHALVAHRVDASELRELADAADTFADHLANAPLRSRMHELANSPRLAGLGEGSLGDLISDGAFIDLFHDSPVSGAANPFGIGLRLTRHRDTAVGTVRLDAGFEGAPGRAHGGVVAACIDETMGAMLPIVGTMAFTGSLSITYLAPCPLHTEIKFRAWLDHRDGRKLYIKTTGESSDGVFVTADAVFIAVDLAEVALHDTGR